MPPTSSQSPPRSQSPQQSEVVRSEFLRTRADLLTTAATLDRIDAAGGQLDQDAQQQLSQLVAAIGILIDRSPQRAVRLQQLFSRPYDDDWRQKFDVDSVAKIRTDAPEIR